MKMLAFKLKWGGAYNTKKPRYYCENKSGGNHSRK